MTAASDLSPKELVERLRDFVRESNRIEGIQKTTQRHIDAHVALLAAPLTVANIVAFVGEVQPNARFRNETPIPGVRVGNHIAPPSGPHIETELRSILAMREPWEQHIAYETLHPFTDGNGRSGRAIWLHRHYHEDGLDRWAIGRGFLHSWYYHTLSNARIERLTAPPDGEMVERVARAIDPDAWAWRDKDVERRDEWEREIKIGWGDVTFDEWVNRSVVASLDRARAAISAMGPALAAERERCAKVADSFVVEADRHEPGSAWDAGKTSAAWEIAAAIRSLAELSSGLSGRGV